MKQIFKVFLFLFLFLLTKDSYAQTTFMANDISGDTSSTGVAIGDVDGDSDLDIYSTNGNLWVNDGSENFTANNIPGDAGGNDAVMGDFDGDNDNDIYVITNGQNKLWINDGLGNFTSNDITGDTGDSRAVAIGDVDGDSDLDIYVGNYSSGFQTQNKIWINNGLGSFTANDATGDLRNASSAVMADIDGDNDLDIFVTNINSGFSPSFEEDDFLINDGLGNFTLTSSFWAGTSAGAAFGDVDGDSDLDLYIAKGSGQQNELWLNNGSGVFSTASNIIGDTGNSTDVAMGDIDNDGDNDIYTLNSGAQNKLWINDGLGNFTSNDITGDTGNSYRVVIIDIDDDTDLDIYVADSTSQNKLWINQLITPPSTPSVSVSSGATSGVYRFACKDPRALNYKSSPFWGSRKSLCRYGNEIEIPVIEEVINTKPNEEIIIEDKSKLSFISRIISLSELDMSQSDIVDIWVSGEDDILEIYNNETNSQLEDFVYRVIYYYNLGLSDEVILDIWKSGSNNEFSSVCLSESCDNPYTKEYSYSNEFIAGLDISLMDFKIAEDNYVFLGSIKDHEVYKNTYFIQCPDGCDSDYDKIPDVLSSYEGNITSSHETEVRSFYDFVEKAYEHLNISSLKKGNQGQNVTILQKNLNTFSALTGYSLGMISLDGNFGSITTKAVKMFQKYQGLIPDGIVGSKTQYALNNIFEVIKDCPPFCKIQTTDNNGKYISLNGKTYTFSNLSLEDISQFEDKIYNALPDCPPYCVLTSPEGESWYILDGNVYEDNSFTDPVGFIVLDGVEYDLTAKDDDAPNLPPSECSPFCSLLSPDLMVGLLSEAKFPGETYFISCLGNCDKNEDSVPDIIQNKISPSSLKTTGEEVIEKYRG